MGWNRHSESIPSQRALNSDSNRGAGSHTERRRCRGNTWIGDGPTAAPHDAAASANKGGWLRGRIREAIPVDRLCDSHQRNALPLIRLGTVSNAPND
jgi:hypothetical protein